MNPLLYLYQYAMTVSSMRWHLLSSDVFLINAVFCRHNIAGINGSKLSFTESAGGVYWFAVFTNPLGTNTGPRCCLLMCDVVYKSAVKIYQSAGVNNWSAEKNYILLKTDPFIAYPYPITQTIGDRKVGVLATCLMIWNNKRHSIYLYLSKIKFRYFVTKSLWCADMYCPSHTKFIYKRQYFPHPSLIIPFPNNYWMLNNLKYTLLLF